MSNGLDEFIGFEKYADQEIAKLSLWKLPIRSLLSWIYLSADSQYIGLCFFRSRKPNDEVGTAMLTRLSYVTPYFRACNRQIGQHVDDALGAVDSNFEHDIAQMLGYAHFCEIMPLVRRGFFSVESKPGIFHLDHPDEGFRQYEERDILMSEIVLAHDLVPPPYPIDSCERMVKALPNIHGGELITVLGDGFVHYLKNVFEIPLLDDKAFKASFGFDRAEFTRVRAALMSYADFCLCMADAAERRSVRVVTSPKQEMLQREVREWAAPLLKRNHVLGVSASVAGVDRDTVERICSVFTLDLDRLDSTGGGENFFPPFLRLDDSLLFSPYAIKRMMPERNLLYSLLRTDQRKFDEALSHHLEPALLSDAAETLSRLPGVEIRRNIQWKFGEIDLMVLHAKSKSALQIQAKAAIPPQGARMIAQIENRTEEAVKQIKRFLQLGETQRDAVFSQAFGFDLTGISWTSGVLARSCLGTEKAWKSIEEFVPLNPILLKKAVNRMLAKVDFSLDDLARVVDGLLDDLKSAAVIDWKQKSFSVFGAEIMLPLLDLNYAVIAEFRNSAMDTASL